MGSEVWVLRFLEVVATHASRPLVLNPKQTSRAQLFATLRTHGRASDLDNRDIHSIGPYLLLLSETWLNPG